MSEKEEENNIKLTKEKIRKQQEKDNTLIDNNSLFSETGHHILGKERNVLLKKVKQYKNLFPEELKIF
jgi:hypothetical protein